MGKPLNALGGQDSSLSLTRAAHLHSYHRAPPDLRVCNWKLSVFPYRNVFVGMGEQDRSPLGTCIIDCELGGFMCQAGGCEAKGKGYFFYCGYRFRMDVDAAEILQRVYKLWASKRKNW